MTSAENLCSIIISSFNYEQLVMQSYVFIKYILSCAAHFILSISQKLNRHSKVEITVVHKLNQGSIPIPPEAGRFRVCFFGSFSHKQKRTIAFSFKLILFFTKQFHANEKT